MKKGSFKSPPFTTRAGVTHFSPESGSNLEDKERDDDSSIVLT
jgi:hypothetical protein